MTESRRIRIGLVPKAKDFVAAMCEQASTVELAQAKWMLPSQVAAWNRQERATIKDAFAAGRRKRAEQSMVQLLQPKIGQQ